MRNCNVLAKSGHVRHLILSILFFVTALNYADRGAFAIAGVAASKQLGINDITFGILQSAFGWAYVAAQIPGGLLLDRYGSKRVYAYSILGWSIVTLLQGFTGHMTLALAVVSFFTLRLLLGIAESPSFPGNSRIVAAWFPSRERGTAAAIFNSAQYFSTVMFAPLTGWIVHSFGWEYAFIVLGAIGIALTLLWLKTIHNPTEHPIIRKPELDFIHTGGAVIDMDRHAAASGWPSWNLVKQLLANRMLLGIYTGQYCITTMTYFFLTWFPPYLIKGRGMSVLNAGFVASLPALCGFFGGVLGGVISDHLLRRGHSLSIARKTPIVIGMLLSTAMIICNYVDRIWLVILIMSLAFFGKGIGSLGWAVVSDTSPKQVAGLSGGLFNMFGNTAAITTPIIIGYLVQQTKSFNAALIFVAANAILAILCYLLIVGDIRRVELK